MVGVTLHRHRRAPQSAWLEPGSRNNPELSFVAHTDAVLTGTKVPLGERGVREGGVSG